MKVYQTEDEQLTVLKDWFMKNGRTIVLGIAIGLIAVFSVQIWKSNRQDYNQSASVAFQDVLGAARNLEISAMQPVGDSKAKNEQQLQRSTLNQLGGQLIKEYPNSIYAQLTALLLAKQAVSDDQLKKAEENLQWVLDQNPDNAMRFLVQLRLARVLFSANRLTDAQALLSVDKDNSYFPLYKELEGDILAKQGKLADAKKSYQAALAGFIANKEAAPLLTMKMDNL